MEERDGLYQDVLHGRNKIIQVCRGKKEMGLTGWGSMVEIEGGM